MLARRLVDALRNNEIPGKFNGCRVSNEDDDAWNDTPGPEDSETANDDGSEEGDQEESGDVVITKTNTDTTDRDVDIEQEIVVYARVSNFAQMKKAVAAEKQEQWVIKVPKSEKNGSDGIIRVRKTIDLKQDTKYNVTCKTPKDTGKLEAHAAISKGFFESVKVLADNGMHKHRYTFKSDGKGQWMIDCYPDGKEGYLTWVRAEYEFEGDPPSSMPELPIDVEEMITPEQQKTDEGKNRVTELFEHYFLSPNPLAVELGVVEDKEEEPREVSAPEQTDDRSPQDDQSNDDDQNTDEQESSPDDEDQQQGDSNEQEEEEDNDDQEDNDNEQDNESNSDEPPEEPKEDDEDEGPSDND